MSDTNNIQKDKSLGCLAPFLLTIFLSFIVCELVELVRDIHTDFTRSPEYIYFINDAGQFEYTVQVGETYGTYGDEYIRMYDVRQLPKDKKVKSKPRIGGRTVGVIKVGEDIIIVGRQVGSPYWYQIEYDGKLYFLNTYAWKDIDKENQCNKRE